MNTTRFRLRRNFSSFINKPFLSTSCSDPAYHPMYCSNTPFNSIIPHHRNLYLTVTSPEGQGQEILTQRPKKLEKSSLEDDELKSSSSVEQKSTSSEPRSQLKQHQLLGDQLQHMQLKLAPRRNSDSSEVMMVKRKHYRRVKNRLRNVNSLSPAPRYIHI